MTEVVSAGGTKNIPRIQRTSTPVFVLSGQDKINRET